MFNLAEFTKYDAVPAPDRTAYTELTATLEQSLAPNGALEICYAAEVLRATWRLRTLAAKDTSPLDDDARTALERTRARAFTELRLSTAELRKLQKEREFRAAHNSDLKGLASLREILNIRKRADGLSQEPAPTTRTQNLQNQPNMGVKHFEAAFQAQIMEEERTQLAEVLAEFNDFTQRGQIGSVLSPQGFRAPHASGQRSQFLTGRTAA